MSEKIATEMGEKMERHTPGPWVEGDIGLVGANGKMVDVARLRVGHVSAFENPEAVANGLLMKAAPDLLSALQAAVECGMVPTSSVADGGAARHVRQIQVADQIRAAISKATTQERDRS